MAEGRTKDRLHAPVFGICEHTGCMVTRPTLYRRRLFNSPKASNPLQSLMFTLPKQRQWRLEVQAVFSNHWHFVAQNKTDWTFLRDLIQELHCRSATALNKHCRTPGWRVWFNYPGTSLTCESSYLADMNSVRVADWYPLPFSCVIRNTLVSCSGEDGPQFQGRSGATGATIFSSNLPRL